MGRNGSAIQKVSHIDTEPGAASKAQYQPREEGAVPFWTAGTSVDRLSIDEWPVCWLSLIVGVLTRKDEVAASIGRS
jgi:hypothetical protein